MTGRGVEWTIVRLSRGEVAVTDGEVAFCCGEVGMTVGEKLHYIVNYLWF